MSKILLLFILACLVWYHRNNNNEVRVIRNALSPSQLNALRKRLPRDQLYHATNTDAHLGQSGRKSVPVKLDSFQIRIGNYVVHPGIPPEYRVYYTGSHGMDWHRDQRVLPAGVGYYECVLTLFNDSDSVFECKDRCGGLFTRTIRPTTNTLVMLRPEGVEHRVTPVTVGNREILKFVVVPSPMVTGVHHDVISVRDLNMHDLH